MLAARDRRTSPARCASIFAKSPRGEHGRLVGGGRSSATTPSSSARRSIELRVERLELGLRGAPRSIAASLRREHVGLERARHEVEARADELRALVVELLRLDQHLLAHADLAEVVEEARVLELAQILAREVRVLVGAVRSRMSTALASSTVRSATRRE